MMKQLFDKLRNMRDERKQFLFEKDHAQFILESTDDLMCEGIGERFTVFFEDLFNNSISTVFYNNDRPEDEYDLVIDSFYCDRFFDPVIQKCKYTLYSPWANYVFVYNGPGVQKAEA